MSMEQKKQIYEILIRFSPDGAVSGIHKVDQMIVADTASGKVLQATREAPGPVEAADLDRIVSAENARLLARLSDLQAQCEKLKEALNE